MQKVYLLLRNNQQTGPHTLEELLQKELKPQDLIWVEGRSAGWSYPSEIDIIKPYLHWNTMPAKPEPTTEPSPFTTKVKLRAATWRMAGGVGV